MEEDEAYGAWPSEESSDLLLAESIPPARSSRTGTGRIGKKKEVIEEAGKVPAFVAAMWAILMDESWASVIKWTSDGS